MHEIAAAKLERAIAGAARAIISAQKPDGSWSDFDINGIGASDQWVTAHIGLKLRQSEAGLHTDALLDSAATYLRDHWNGGLAYNAFSPADADSTAHALLFWQSLGWRPLAEYSAVLLEFQLDDGGFATFRPQGGESRNSWATAHPEVTAVAIQALSPTVDDRAAAQAINRALHWAERVAGWDTCSRSFWWNLDWFARLQWVKALQLSGRQIPAELASPVDERRFKITSHLDAAYLIEFCLILGRLDDADMIGRSLLETQQENGLWPTAPVLRLIPPELGDLREQSYHPITYADEGRYSGAAILHALALLARAAPKK